MRFGQSPWRLGNPVRQADRRIPHVGRQGRGRGKDIVMFGHTHRPLIDIHEDITLINPGSISYPRQEGKKPTYITMEIDENGEALFTLHTIE